MGEMVVHHSSFQVQSKNFMPNFHDVTNEVKEIVSASGVKNGIAVVYSQHTTCSVMIQEDSHDALPDGTKYLLQDLIDIFERIVPKCKREGQYWHPGPELIKHAVEELGEERAWALNTDGHLRSSIIGRSESIPIVEGQLELGEFGLIYFIDFDSVRERKRFVHVQVIGEK